MTCFDNGMKWVLGWVRGDSYFGSEWWTEESQPPEHSDDRQPSGGCNTVIVADTSLLDLVHSYTPNHTMHIQPSFLCLNFQGHILLI